MRIIHPGALFDCDAGECLSQVFLGTRSLPVLAN